MRLRLRSGQKRTGGLPRPPRPRPPHIWEDPRPGGLPLGRAAPILLHWVDEAGQVFGEHEEELDDVGELVRESQHVCLGRLPTKVQTKFIATDGRTTDPLRDPATLNVLLVLTVTRSEEHTSELQSP